MDFFQLSALCDLRTTKCLFQNRLENKVQNRLPTNTTFLGFSCKPLPVEDSNYTNTKSILFCSQTHFNPSHVRIHVKAQKKKLQRQNDPQHTEVKIKNTNYQTDKFLHARHVGLHIYAYLKRELLPRN